MHSPLLLSYSRPGMYIATWKSSGIVLSRKKRELNSQNSLLLGKLYLNSCLVISLCPKVDVPMHFVLSKAEKHEPYWELVCPAESIML